MSRVIRARMMVAVLAAVGAMRTTLVLRRTPVLKGRDNVILRMAKQWCNPEQELGGTIWRYFETWQTDVVRLDSGELLRVEPYVYRKKTKSESQPQAGRSRDPAGREGPRLPIPAQWLAERSISTTASGRAAGAVRRTLPQPGLDLRAREVRGDRSGASLGPDARPVVPGRRDRLCQRPGDRPHGASRRARRAGHAGGPLSRRDRPERREALARPDPAGVGR